MLDRSSQVNAKMPLLTNLAIDFIFHPHLWSTSALKGQIQHRLQFVIGEERECAGHTLLLDADVRAHAFLDA